MSDDGEKQPHRLPEQALDRLLAIMDRLRDPDDGCPWDLEQDFASIAPHTIEEAYEVADAIDRGDMTELRGELGDLLFQVVFHSRMAAEQGAFSFHDVAADIAEKMIQRHPHIFGRETVGSAEEMVGVWERLKERERQARSDDGRRVGALDGVALGLPALLRALKLQKRAARVGFDWDSIAPVMAKLREETDELAEAMDRGGQADRTEEIGDLLFTAVNLARHMDIDPEAALRGANAKFERRFRHVEDRLAADGRSPKEAGLEEMDRYWNEARAADRNHGV